jgi:hypothetical protein
MGRALPNCPDRHEITVLAPTSPESVFDLQRLREPTPHGF